MPIEAVAQEHRSAGVTPAAPWRVRAVNVLPGYRLSITCNDGSSGIVDMSVLVNSSNAGIFAALKSAELFQQVSIEHGALTWPNGADLDPAWTHEEVSKNQTWSVPEVSLRLEVSPTPDFRFQTMVQLELESTILVPASLAYALCGSRGYQLNASRQRNRADRGV